MYGASQLACIENTGAVSLVVSAENPANVKAMLAICLHREIIDTASAEGTTVMPIYTPTAAMMFGCSRGEQSGEVVPAFIFGGNCTTLKYLGLLI